MKRTLLVICCCFLCMCLFAAKLTKVDVKNIFGDATGESYITFDSDLSGTYVSQSSSGNLKWNIRIDPVSGSVDFILKEDGKDKSISALESNDSEKFTVFIKDENGAVTEFAASTKRSDTYKNNWIHIAADMRSFLQKHKTITVGIKGSYGEYVLCSMSFGGIDDLLGKFYVIGDIGPAGGFVFYDCDADNDLGNADGLTSSECGWRYLEAAPTDLGGVYPFGYYRSSSGSNLYVGTKTAIGTGKANTEALVKAMGESAYTDSSGTTKVIYAAKACADYSITVDGVVYDDWFLPSKDELDLMCYNLKAKYVGSFADYYYWSSSEDSNKYACLQFFYDGYAGYGGNQYDYSRDSIFYVRPVRAFR